VRAVLASLGDEVARLVALNVKAALIDGGMTALHVAAVCGNSGAVAALLEAGAAVNVASSDEGLSGTALHRASTVEVVQALLKGGAAVNDASNGVTPLCMASAYGRVEVVQALIGMGAEVSPTASGGTTPLFVASQDGHVDVVRALLAARADLHAPDCWGVTPLHAAAGHGHAGVVGELLAAGADASLRDQFGCTAAGSVSGLPHWARGAVASPPHSRYVGDAGDEPEPAVAAASLDLHVLLREAAAWRRRRAAVVACAGPSLLEHPAEPPDDAADVDAHAGSKRRRGRSHGGANGTAGAATSKRGRR
jgi:ankyrin repeat protein